MSKEGKGPYERAIACIVQCKRFNLTGLELVVAGYEAGPDD
jgi:hypothetical protein